MMDFRKAVTDDRVYVFDGAMGTMIYSRGVYINKCYDELNLSQSDLILGLHREYVKAGADILETNTYGANRVKLKAYGLEDKIRDINLAGVRLAREAANGRAFVAGAIGTLGIRLSPTGRLRLKRRRRSSASRRRLCWKAALTSSCSKPSPTSPKSSRRFKPYAVSVTCRLSRR